MYVSGGATSRGHCWKEWNQFRWSKGLNVQSSTSGPGSIATSSITFFTRSYFWKTSSLQKTLHYRKRYGPWHFNPVSKINGDPPPHIMITSDWLTSCVHFFWWRSASHWWHVHHRWGVDSTITLNLELFFTNFYLLMVNAILSVSIISQYTSVTYYYAIDWNKCHNT